MNNKNQNDTPSLIRWLHRKIFRGFGWFFVAFMLMILYLFVLGFLRSRGM